MALPGEGKKKFKFINQCVSFLAAGLLSRSFADRMIDNFDYTIAVTGLFFTN